MSGPAVNVAAPSNGSEGKFAHALLFTGHMIDRADRTDARFPAWAESRARKAIHAALGGIEWVTPGTTIGLAGGASGGDLLFHECCQALGIPTRLLLALPPDQFEPISVAPAGPNWVKRFHALLKSVGDALQVMQKSEGMQEGPSDTIWQRANLWMMEEANRLAPERAVLALWDGNVGDGPGGTEHFLQIAPSFGVRVLRPIEMRTVLQMNDASED